jgi:hypothetical protein
MLEKSTQELVKEVVNKEEFVTELMGKMTLAEKIGQMSQFAGRGGIPHDLADDIRQGNAQ